MARVDRPHGLKGEVVVTPVTNRPERFEPGAVHDAAGRRLVVERARPRGRRWIVAYEGVTDRDGAERLRDVTLRGAAEDADPDAVWLHDVAGATVVDAAGVERGRVVSVEVNPAHDLLVLDTGALVPVVFVRSFGRGVVSVDAPEGLFEEPAGPPAE